MRWIYACELKQKVDNIKKMPKLSKYEDSPWKSVNQLGDKYEKYAHEITHIVLDNVMKVLGKMAKAHDDAPLIFKGKIQYNPKDGKPIKAKDWKKLEEAIIKYLGIEKDALQTKITEDSYFLGTLINRIENENKKRNTNFSKFKLDNPDWKTYGYTDFDKDMILASKQGAGIYLQNVTDKVRSKIQSILVEGTKAKKTKGKVFNELWDSQVALNRDWDRVIRTETAYAVNNGLLISELRQEPSDDPIFMKGISAPGACPYCLSLVNEKIVVLVDEAPATGDTVKIDGVEYNTIWPGKSNFGRKARDYWAATIIHPYCRCSWTRWYLELEDLLKETNNL